MIKAGLWPTLYHSIRYSI